MNMRRAFLLAFAAIDTAVAQLNTTAPTAALLTNPPTNRPTNPPTKSPTISPTNLPSLSPTMKKNTTSPSLAPSLTPSMSNAPTVPPSESFQPTPSPTISANPTAKPSASPSYQPTVSKQPSFVPTVSAVPTAFPSGWPSIAPIIPPSSAPSMVNETVFIAEYKQVLQVTKKFDNADDEKYCRLYNSYTKNFGYFVGEPLILTTCNIKEQAYGVTRRKLSLWNRLRRMLQEETSQYRLVMNFFMKYETRVGVYDLDDYNEQFKDYVNSNTTKVFEDMTVLLQMPVISVENVIKLEYTSPTIRPTIAPQTEAPAPPTLKPSVAPSRKKPPFIDIPEVSQNSFVLGLSLGLSGAFAVAAVGFIYYRHLEKQKQNDELVQNELAGDNNDMDIAGTAEGIGDSMEVKVSDHKGVLSQDDITNDGSDNDDDGGGGGGGGGHGVVRDNNTSVQLLQSSPPRIGAGFDIESGAPVNAGVSSSVGAAPMAHPMAYATMDSIFSQQVSQAQQAVQAQQAQTQYQESYRGGAPTNLMMADASFSSDSEDELGNPSAFDGSHDELDNYKNHDLEILRNTVEDAVEDVEGMLSLAMTRALTEGEDALLPWGSEDSGSIEASCLFETYDWLKRNEKSPLVTRNEFFQEVINGIVITVLFGLMHPLEAAQLAHGVATVIGLPLLKELPKKTLVITGMRKTNDVDRGQHVILAAFERFGPIEQAAIAPNNRGFGFVRFSKPKSVQRALEKYRTAEIEIQNVSVSIKTLENITPARE